MTAPTRDPNMATHDLSGDWQGFYEQEGSRHAISMRLVQHGSALQGTMRDQDTMMMGALDAEDAQDLRELFAADDDAEPEVITTLPADSTIEGETRGGTIAFVKRYQGPQRTALWLDGVQVDIELEGHRVHYRGTIEANGTELRGEWWLDPLAEEEEDPDDRAGVDRGTFVMFRDARDGE